MNANALLINNLSYKYKTGKNVINDLDLTVENGARVALVGPNGSGKTTLLYHITGFLNGTGEIMVCGITRSKKNMKEIRKKIGFLFSQVEYQFIMPDLLSDILLSVPEKKYNKKERNRQAELWLQKLGIIHYKNASPLDLSSGEMKRAALAGVLASEPELLILDEPLANLDKAGAKQLLDILSGINTTMIIATHKKYILEKLATHVAVMQEGRIKTYMPVRDALKLPALHELLF